MTVSDLIAILQQQDPAAVVVLRWDWDEDDAAVALTCDELRPGAVQAVQLHRLQASTDWHGEGEVSSAVVSFDYPARTANTESGNQYELAGRGTGLGMNAQYVWQLWCMHCAAMEITDVTKEIKELLSNEEGE